MNSKLGFVLLPFVMLAACDEPVNYSDKVTLNLKIDADKVDKTSNVISSDKGISTESGNPYGKFVNDAQRILGQAPARIEVDSATLFLGPSTGVSTLGAVWDGQVEVIFVMDTSNNAYPVATATVNQSVATSGPLELTVTFDSTAVADADYSRLLGGSFKVLLRGPVQPSFADGSAKTDQQVTLTFAAYE